jgi:hypothetical protein
MEVTWEEIEAAQGVIFSHLLPSSVSQKAMSV